MPVDIKGKKYTTVAERIDKLRRESPYSIATEFIKLDPYVCTIKAILTIYKDDKEFTYTGHAHELQSSSYINESSFVENCETSAIGRALSAAGYGGGEFCSADELTNALKNKGKTSNYQGNYDSSKSKTYNMKPAAYCEECKAGITEGIKKVSESKYDKILCIPCQKKQKTGLGNGNINPLIESRIFDEMIEEAET